MRSTTWRVAAVAAALTQLAACASRAGGESLAQQGAGGAPQVITLRGEELVRAKARLAAKDTLLAPALAKLMRDADKALQSPLVAVTDKHTLLPPSGNKHD